MSALTSACDDTLLDEIDKPIREQFGVDPEVFVVSQQPQHLVRDCADSRLQRSAVWDALRNELGDLAVDVSSRSVRQFRERVIGFAPPNDLAQMHLVLTEGAGHSMVYLDE